MDPDRQDELRRYCEALDQDESLDPVEREDRKCERSFYVVLRAEMTGPRWLEGLEVGWVFGTPMGDAWLDDSEYLF
ncbi:MAG TPA: hypothetical protein RMH99_21955 [Sandaracinaceae bacterium LLY-WYZ-13_1]|nr:hypothetical protein [Sandaracinaceae bacterium LLY-WYZ-13_1]